MGNSFKHCCFFPYETNKTLNVYRIHSSVFMISWLIWNIMNLYVLNI